MSSPWVFPLGHYLGPFFPGRGEPMQAHRLRIGRDITNLLTDAEFALWALAHGVPDTGQRPWSRDEISKAFDAQADVDVPVVLAELVAEGVLAEADPGTPQAVEFARSHRFHALLTGL